MENLLYLLSLAPHGHPNSVSSQDIDLNDQTKDEARLLGHLHQLLQAGEVDIVDALLRWRSDVLLDVGSVHKRQVYLICHIGGRQDHHVGMSEI